MSTIIALIGCSLPGAVRKVYNHYIITSAVYMGIATSMVGSGYNKFVAVLYILAVILLIVGLRKKMHVIYAGYKEGIFIIYDYTYLHRHSKTPSGLLLLPQDGTFNGIYLHVAISNGLIPPVGGKIRLTVPGDAKVKQYGDRVYFPVVYGYKIEEKMGTD